MRIGIDARPIAGRMTGDRTYWRGLVRGLASIDFINEYVLFLRHPLSNEDDLDLPSNFKIRAMGSASDRVWSMMTFKQGLRQEQCDLAHVQYTLPPFLPCPAVTTIHDISFRLFPKLFSTQDRTLLNMSVPDSIRRAKHVLTVSESSRNDILSAYPFLAQGKITSTYLAADSIFAPAPENVVEADRLYLAEKYEINKPFILSVGVLQPRKNLPMLIRAFCEARWSAGFAHILVIVGKIGWLSDETMAAITYAGDAVKLAGYVPDDDLPRLYRCAEITAYPSLYEGFGLPVLEAMACGCPVVSSNSSSLPEVVGAAGILLMPDDMSAWSVALSKLIRDSETRRRMSQDGLVQATKFSWAETARITKEIYLRSGTTKHDD